MAYINNKDKMWRASQTGDYMTLPVINVSCWNEITGPGVMIAYFFNYNLKFTLKIIITASQWFLFTADW